jgi:uncharacterized protein HemX
MTEETTNEQAASKKSSVDTAKVLDEMAKKTEGASKTQSKKPGPKRKAPSGNRSLLATLLLILPLLGGLAFLAWQQRELQAALAQAQQQSQTLQGSLQQQASTLAELNGAIESLRSEVGSEEGDDSEQLATLRRELQQAIAAEAAARESELAALQNRLSQQISSAATAPTVQSRDWKLPEALYLLGVAGRKLSLERDKQSALELMRQADQALADSDNPAVFNVRQQLAEELGELQAFVTLDQADISARLAGLSSRLANLELVDRASQRVLATVPPIDAGWFEASLDFLSSVFVWRRIDGEAALRLSPSEQLVLREQARLALQQAQLALLSRDSARYRSSLQGAALLLDSLLGDTDSTAASLRTELDQLATIDIDQALPQPQESLEMLRRLIANSSQR